MAMPSWWRSTEELFDDRSGVPFDDTGGENKRQYIRRFRVMVNTPLVDQVTVGFGPGIPERLDGNIAAGCQRNEPLQAGT